MTSFAEFYGGTLSVLGAINVVVDNPDGSTGWPATLTKGDSYTTENGQAFQIYIKNGAGTTLEALGSTQFSDDAVFVFDSMHGRDQSSNFTGDVSWNEVGKYFGLSIPASETDKALAWNKYEGQLILWPSGFRRTILRQVFTIAPKIT